MNQIKLGQRIEHATANRPHGTVFAITPEYIGIRWDDGQIDRLPSKGPDARKLLKLRSTATTR